MDQDERRGDEPVPMLERWATDTGPYLLLKTSEQVARYRAENPPSKLFSVEQYQGVIDDIVDHKRRRLAQDSFDQRDWDGLNEMVATQADGELSN